MTRANEAIDYLDQRWGAETARRRPHRRGAAGSLTQFGPLLRRPVGPLHWAGTETADEWTGFMEERFAPDNGPPPGGRHPEDAGGLSYEVFRCADQTPLARSRKRRFTSSGCSRIAQWPPVISTSSSRLGAASAILRARQIGNSRSFVLPITNVGTVSPLRSM